MKKQEISNFKKYYLPYLNNTTIFEWLEKAVDFERPDGYYYDEINKLLVIFEHFEIDCSERPTKKGKTLGSSLHRNRIVIHKEIQEEIASSNNNLYESTKGIVQGYCSQNGNVKTFYIGQDGGKYRNNFINNFLESFAEHERKVDEYKNSVINQLKIQPLETKVCFIIEDKTIFGSHYLNDKNSQGDPVILTDTLQFQEVINSSNVDLVVFCREDDFTTYIGLKGNNLINKIDLYKKEFFIIPLALKITVAKKLR